MHRLALFLVLSISLASCQETEMKNSTPMSQNQQIELKSIVGKWYSLNVNGDFDNKGWIVIKPYEGTSEKYSLEYYHQDNLAGIPGLLNGYIEETIVNGKKKFKGMMNSEGDFSTQDIMITAANFTLSFVQSINKNENNALSLLAINMGEMPIVYGVFQKQ